jgi:hypothetical protein
MSKMFQHLSASFAGQRFALSVNLTVSAPRPRPGHGPRPSRTAELHLWRPVQWPDHRPAPAAGSAGAVLKGRARRGRLAKAPEARRGRSLTLIGRRRLSAVRAGFWRATRPLTLSASPTSRSSVAVTVAGCSMPSGHRPRPALGATDDDGRGEATGRGPGPRFHPCLPGFYPMGVSDASLDGCGTVVRR